MFAPGPKAKRSDEFARKVANFQLKMKRQQMDTALQTARATLELMRDLLSTSRHDDPLALVLYMRAIGIEITIARPQDLAVGNMVRRVLRVVREVAADEGLEITTETQSSEAHSADLGAVSSRPVSLFALLDQQAPSKAEAGAKGEGAAAAPALLAPAPAPAPTTPPASSATPPSPLVASLAPVAMDSGEARVGSGASPGNSPKQPTGRPAAPAAAAAAVVTAQQPLPPVSAPAASVAESGAEVGGVPSRLAPKKKGKRWAGIKKVLDRFKELFEELDICEHAIVEAAPQHIHTNEIILTFGLSTTTLKFLQHAAERRKFQVIVAEGAPMLAGLTMAQSLVDEGIPTLVIPDSCIFAIMARVNKVLVGAQAVLATGGVLARSGSRLVALAAKHYRVPFVVVTGLYKLSPLFPHDPHVMFSTYSSPSSFATRKLKSSALRVGDGGVYEQESLHLPCPTVDYIEPELVDLLITDSGGYTPSYIYRLLSEYYHREDYVLSQSVLSRLGG